MNRAELIKAVSEKTNFTIENSDTAVSAVIDILTDCLKAHERIIIHGFLTLKPVTTSARKYRNMYNGEIETSTPKRNYKVIVCPDIVDTLNENR